MGITMYREKNERKKGRKEEEKQAQTTIPHPYLGTHVRPYGP